MNNVVTGIICVCVSFFKISPSLAQSYGNNTTTLESGYTEDTFVVFRTLFATIIKKKYYQQPKLINYVAALSTGM